MTGFDGRVDSRYHACWVVEFDADGRCGEYQEWYVEGPATPAKIAP